jgi:myo-inositol catabolism protein IolC
MPRGYDRTLYVQPVDHRGSFQSGLFGWKPPLSADQTAEIAASKRIIYDGFLGALAAGAPRDKSAILVDEQFGAAILRDAKAEAQLDALRGDKKAYDLQVRPRLMVQAIRELQQAGVEPDLWKIEGLERREDCEAIVAAARAVGRTVFWQPLVDCKSRKATREQAVDRIATRYREFVDLYEEG